VSITGLGDIPMGKCGIYKLKNHVNGKIYIGQSVNIRQRISKHVNTKPGSKTEHYLQKAISKYGQDNFSISILYECEKRHLNRAEVILIKQYMSMCPNGYNLNSGGKSNHTVSEDAKKKMSIKAKGRKFSETHKANISKAKTGIPRPAHVMEKLHAGRKKYVMPEEARRKSSIFHTGKKMSKESIMKTQEGRKGFVLSEESRRKISKTLSGRKPSMEHRVNTSRGRMKGVVIQCSNGNVYQSIFEAKIDTGLSTSVIFYACKRGTTTMQGLTFNKLKKDMFKEVELFRLRD